MRKGFVAVLGVISVLILSVVLVRADAFAPVFDYVIEQTIDDDFEGAVRIYVIDLDDDGDEDILGTAETAGQFAWYENDGNENFTKHIFAENFDNAFGIFAIDWIRMVITTFLLQQR